jgi:hypothetical protein
MRRGGFLMPSTLMFILFALLGAGFIVRWASQRFMMVFNSSVNRTVTGVAYIGMKGAEDWLLSSVASGSPPSARKNSLDPNPERRIEAVLGDGNPIGDMPHVLSMGVKVYVADADYAAGLFTGGILADMSSALYVPRMPMVVSGDTERRFYFLRSAASSDQGDRAADEEMIAVSIDRVTGAVEVERLFYRSGQR